MRLRSLIGIIGCLGSAIACSGCAYTNATRVNANDPNVQGFVFYECKPLIAVSGSSISVQYIKNPDRAYSVQFFTFLAKNNLKATFDRDCGLTSIDSNQDTTAIIQLLEKALDKVAQTPVPAKSTDPTGTVVQLYDVIFDDRGNIVRLKPLIPAGSFRNVPSSG